MTGWNRLFRSRIKCSDISPCCSQAVTTVSMCECVWVRYTSKGMDLEQRIMMIKWDWKYKTNMLIVFVLSIN